MFPEWESAEASRAVAGLQAARAAVNALPLHTLSDADLLGVLGEQEADTRRAAAASHAVIAELQARGTARDHGCPSTTALLVQLLRITPHEASGRVKAAAKLAPRRGLSGELLAALFAPVAAAQGAGQISAAHARVITDTLEQLPEQVAAENQDWLQDWLLEQAHTTHPFQLAQIARATAYLLDQDGALATEQHRHRQRDLRITRRPDGSAHLHGELTALCTEALLSMLEPLAAPAPTGPAGPAGAAGAAGGKDPRGAGQRRHDALYDAALITLRSQQLPDCAGVAATIVLHLTEQQIHTRTGLVRTGHGAQISAGDALTLLGQARIFPVTLSHDGQILDYGPARRIFTEGQRLAMTARDHGCTFPGCTQPPSRCQAHHITDYALTRRTSVDDGALLCGFHHREHPKLGWTCHMINGTPHWTPPHWLDPTQTPRRNHAHAPALL